MELLVAASFQGNMNPHFPRTVAAVLILVQLALVLHSAAGDQPAPAAQSATERFLGSAEQWDKCTIELRDVRPARGGYDVDLRGSGLCSVRTVTGEKEERINYRIGAERAVAFRKLLLEHDLAAIALDDPQKAVDEPGPVIRLENARGERLVISRAGNPEVKRFDAVYNAVRSLRKVSNDASSEGKVH